MVESAFYLILPNDRKRSTMQNSSPIQALCPSNASNRNMLPSTAS